MMAIEGDGIVVGGSKCLKRKTEDGRWNGTELMRYAESSFA